MELREPLEHGSLVRRLWQATREGRLPHALAFEGDEGIGKFLAARWFASGLMCAEGPGPPCGECGPCKRVASGGHADLFVIDPEAEGEERIRLARIANRGEESATSAKRESGGGSLEAFLDLRALESAWRVVLIRESHRMNDAAQNALLKTLEEPRPGNVIVLETHRPSKLLATIRSRCVRIRFDPLSPDDCARVLHEAGLDVAAADELARWTGGSPGAALTWHVRGIASMRDLLIRCLTGEAPPLLASAGLWEIEGEFTGAKPTAQARDRARRVLDLALALARDGGRLEAGVPADQLAHGDVAPHFVARGARVRPSCCRAGCASRTTARRRRRPTSPASGAPRTPSPRWTARTGPAPRSTPSRQSGRR